MTKHSVLVVDDEKWIRFFLRDFLEDEGFEVREAENLSIAKEALKSEKTPDLIILDLTLPDGNGISWLNELRKVDVTKNIPILLSSAAVEDHDREFTSLPGLTEELHKPYDINKLRALIKQMVGDTPPQT